MASVSIDETRLLEDGNQKPREWCEGDYVREPLRST